MWRHLPTATTATDKLQEFRKIMEKNVAANTAKLFLRQRRAPRRFHYYDVTQGSNSQTLISFVLE